MQKIASLPSLAAGLLSPAAVAKTSLSKSPSSSTTSSLSQQLAMLNNTGANTNILIKTTKTNSVGQPTYVAISIPTQNTVTTTGHNKVLPLAIHQLKLKQQQHQQDEKEISPQLVTAKIENKSAGTNKVLLMLLARRLVRKIMSFIIYEFYCILNCIVVCLAEISE